MLHSMDRRMLIFLLLLLSPLIPACGLKPSSPVRIPTSSMSIFPLGIETQLTSLAVSPDSSRAAVSDSKGLIRIIDLGSMAVLQTLKTRHTDVSSLTYSPNGRSLIISGNVKKPNSETNEVASCVTIYELKKETATHEFISDVPLGEIAVSSDSLYCAWATYTYQKPSTIHLINLLTGESTSASATPDAKLAIAFDSSHSSANAAIVSAAGVWSVDTNPLRIRLVKNRSVKWADELVKVLLDPKRDRYFVAKGGINHTGGRLIGRNALIEIHSLSSNHLLSRFSIGQDGINVGWDSLALSPDGKLLAAVNTFGVFIFSLDSPSSYIHAAKTHDEWLGMRSAQFTKRGDSLIAISHSELFVYSLASLSPVSTSPKK